MYAPWRIEMRVQFEVFQQRGIRASMTVEAELERVSLRLARAISARLEAEAIAERGLTDLYRRQLEIALLESIVQAW